jgi:ferrous iron transport protein B
MDFSDGHSGNDWMAQEPSWSQLTNLLTDSWRVLVRGNFIPQIAFLFAFISILEESGYMARSLSY